MRYLKNWIKYFELADSPDLVGKFSPDELKKMAKADVFDDSPFRKFQQGFYSGGGSDDLNNFLSDAQQKGYGSMYGISDYLLSELRKGV